jgi:hypothetical protein
MEGMSAAHIENVVKKLETLSPDRVAEVEDFIDFLQSRAERSLVEVAARASEEVFAKVWENAEDAEYDQL